MNHDDELRQQLWELVYGLLPPDEARGLESRITSEPDVARDYAEVKLQAGMLAEATRLEESALQLKRPQEERVAPVTTAAATRPVTPLMASLNTLAAVAIAALVLCAAYVGLRPQSPLDPGVVARQDAELARRYSRTVVTGPARWSSGVENHVAVTTTSLDGEPASRRLSYQLRDRSGKPIQAGDLFTDDQGHARIPVDSTSLDGDLSLEIRGDDGEELLRTQLQVEDIEYATFLSLDRPLYQPGETVRYRSLTLSRYDLSDRRDALLQFEIVSPSGGVISESVALGVTQHGVGSGELALPNGAPGGKYTLIARSPTELFPETKRSFFVRRYRAPRLKKELEFTRDSYAPGDEVLADFAATRAEGGAVAEAPLSIQVQVDGKPVDSASPDAKTNADGAYRVKFRLPEAIAQGHAILAVTVDDGGTSETISETIPINLGKVEVKFYPEGGDLVTGIPSRVYFHSYDPLGEPVHVEGRVVDDQGREVAGVETFHEGRGRFEFTPERRRSYHLQIDQPAGVVGKPKLPAVKASGFLAMQTEFDVCEPDQPLKLKIRSKKKHVPLVVAATCRGVAVAHQQLRSERDQWQSIALPLAAGADGVIRLTVYDYRGERPRPLAERLVFRRSARTLNVEVDGHPRSYTPGQPVSLTLRVTDEDGQPQAAALGVSVVDDALLNLADDKSPRLGTHFRLVGDIEEPEDLEDANFYVSTDKKATRALDLLLGTQGWRRFRTPSAEEVAQTEPDAADPAQDPALPTDQALVDDIVQADAPLLYDNRSAMNSAFLAAVGELQLQRQTELHRLGHWLLLGGGGILVTLTLLGLFRLALARVWIPGMMACLVCLFVGGIWTSTRISDDGQLVMGPFTGPSSSSLVAARQWESQGEQVVAWGLQSLPEEREASQLADVLSVSGGLTDDLRRRQLGGEFFQGRFGNDFDAILGRDLGELGNVQRGWGQQLALQFNTWHRRTAESPQRLERHQEKLKDLQKEVRQIGQLAELEAALHKGLLPLEGREKLFGYYHRLGTVAGVGGKQLDADAFKKLQSQLQFPVREYAHQHVATEDEQREDFATLLYWNPLLTTDDAGEATVNFALSDLVTTFRLRADAHGASRIGGGEAELISRLPFNLEPKLPLEVTAGDRIRLPVAVNNNTSEPLNVALNMNVGELLKLDGEPLQQLQLAAEERQRHHYTLDVVGTNGDVALNLRGRGGNLSDAVEKSLRVVPPGFPVSLSYAGRIDGPQQLTVPLPAQLVAGSLEVSLRAFPSSLADLRRGIEGLLREPSGCFEQTSSSNYPNIMALQFMQSHDVADPEFTRRAKELLKKGYGRLVGFECTKQGYEWFGRDPGHEALTAYGLMQFRDMGQVWKVDSVMVERSTRWLMGRRDGVGGFARNTKALDRFGRASPEVTNAYIVWALSEAGKSDIDREMDRVIEVAETDKDPYVLALAASAAANSESRKPTAQRLAELLVKAQQPDGHLEGDATITRSGGISRQVETTALAALAWIKVGGQSEPLRKATEWLVKHRQGSGSFGSTQATVLALKALVEDAKTRRDKVQGGALVVKRDDKEIARATFRADQIQPIEVGDIAAQLQTGDNKLSVELTADNRMPYALEVSYRTRKPRNHPACTLKLNTQLAETELQAGDTVALRVQLANISGVGQPMSIAIVGLPAGLEARQKQLEELTKAGKFDYYELQGRELVFYWRSLGPNVRDEQQIDFQLDLIAEIPGRYAGPASRAYLYYTAEHKHWADPLEVDILP